MKIVAILAAFALTFAFGFTPARTDRQELNLKGEVRKMTQTTREFEGGKQTGEKRIVRYFNKRGFLDTQKHYFNGKLGEVKSYEYDARGYLIKSNNDTLLYRHEYQNHADGSLTERKINSHAISALRHEFITRYDAKGRILEIKNLHGAKLKLISHKIFHYDERGLLTQIEELKNVDVTQRFEYKFNGERITQRCQISKLVKQCSEYDERDQVVRSTYEYEDKSRPQNSKFSESIIYEKELDKQGNLTLSKSFYEKNGAKTGEIKEIVQIEYEYYK